MQPRRIAIISTPRSGSTWLRLMLADLLEIPTFSFHSPREIEFSHPHEFVFQLHWPPTPVLLRRLEESNVKVVTIARHPFGVLTSILRFADRDSSTSCWLLGRSGSESHLSGRSPASPEFRRYVTSERARALLTVTPEWWAIENAYGIRYEDLVTHPREHLSALLKWLWGDESQKSLPSIPETLFDINTYRRSHFGDVHHFWRGNPDSWQEFWTRDLCTGAYERHRSVFRQLGYPAPQCPDLTEAEVIEAWRQEEIEALESSLEAVRSELVDGFREIEQAREVLSNPSVKAFLDEKVGPRGLDIARRLSQLRRAIRLLRPNS